MKPWNSDHRGMSLTELLVVICILGLLAVTIIPAINANSDARKNRAATAAVQSFINQAQARSVGRKTWSGFSVFPISATSNAADQLAFVDCPLPYRGDTATAAIAINGIGTGTAAAPGCFDLLPRYLQGAQANTITIRLGGVGPVYRLTSGSTPSPFSFALQSGPNGEDLGQTAASTPWPAVGATYPVEIFRSPTSAGTPMVIPENRVIDLRWSGFGTNAPWMTNPPGRQFGLGANITVSFDNSGALRQFSYTAPGGSVVTETAQAPLILLIGRADRAGNDPQALIANDDSVGANWQYADSTWVAIDPGTGIATSAPCGPAPLATAQCSDSQAAIREKLKLKQNPRRAGNGGS